MKCPFCDFESTPIGVKIHMSRVHKRNLKCPICGKKIKNMSGWKVHMIKVHKISVDGEMKKWKKT
jgi:transcriptional regulator NrdR family protein